MLREICDVLKGSIAWMILKVRDGIDYNKVVLVLTGENAEVDKYALFYLDKAIERKSAKEALIYILNEETFEVVKKYICTVYKYDVKIINSKVIDHIYKRYCLNKFYKNIFWTFTDKTRNNLLGHFLRETDINAKDAVCLAIYNLRTIPD